MEEQGKETFQALYLPPELWRHILSFLPDREMIQHSLVCRTWRVFLLDLLREKQNTKPQAYRLKLFVDKWLPRFSNKRKGQIDLLNAYAEVIRRIKNELECQLRKEVMEERIAQWLSHPKCTVSKEGQDEIKSMMANLAFVKVSTSSENEHRIEECSLSIKLPLAFWSIQPIVGPFSPFSPFLSASMQSDSLVSQPAPTENIEVATSNSKKRRRQTTSKRQATTKRRTTRKRRTKDDDEENEEEEEQANEKETKKRGRPRITRKKEPEGKNTTTTTTATTARMYGEDGSCFEEIKVNWYWSGESDGGRDYAFICASKGNSLALASFDPMEDNTDTHGVNSNKDIVLAVLGEEISDWDKSLIDRPDWLVNKLRFGHVTRSQLLFALLCGLAHPSHYWAMCQADETLERGIEECIPPSPNDNNNNNNNNNNHNPTRHNTTGTIMVDSDWPEWALMDFAS